MTSANLRGRAILILLESSRGQTGISETPYAVQDLLYVLIVPVEEPLFTSLLIVLIL